MPRPVNSRPDRTPEHLKWTRERVECGKTVRGWIAGKVYGCEGHFAPAFKPCHAVISAGKLACPWCSIPQFAALRYQGYLPMYNERLDKIVLCINLDNTVRCDAIDHLKPIVVGKGKNVTSPLVVNATEWTTIPPSGPKVRKVSQDITPWLFLVLWKQEGLQAYGEVDTRSSSVVPDAPSVHTLSVEPKEGKEYTPAQIKELRAKGFDTLADRIEGVVREPHANGNGKHKPKPR